MARIGKFQWNDGGRSTCGFVGLTGDCVTRSISIATGIAYRDVYELLKERYGSTPRDGVPKFVYGPYLKELCWDEQICSKPYIALEQFEFQGAMSIVQVQDAFGRKSHLCTVIEGVLHDTWDPRDDDTQYLVVQCWSPGPDAVRNRRFLEGVSEVRQTGDLTQSEFEKIIHRLRAIENTARNQASTESERENALRMMQSLLLRHNLSREDLVDREGVESTCYTRLACPVSGSKSLSWEKDLAFYITQHIFPLTQWYSGRKGHRSLFFFYGPRVDVENAIQLFRELLVTIATAAKLLYGGFSRGSGASYAEGYVRSLPKSDSVLAAAVNQRSKSAGAKDTDSKTSLSPEQALILQRSLAVHKKSKDWLFEECGIRLVNASRRVRDFHDPAAESMGRKHGSEHRIDPPSGPKRLN